MNQSKFLGSNHNQFRARDSPYSKISLTCPHLVIVATFNSNKTIITNNTKKFTIKETLKTKLTSTIPSAHLNQILENSAPMTKSSTLVVLIKTLRSTTHKTL